MSIGSLANFEIVTIAISLLGGDRKYVDPEKIAIKADELVPGKFNWRNYSDRIDLGIVRTALRDAKKEKNGALIIGNNVSGWMLSAQGIDFISALDQNNIVKGEDNVPRRSSIEANIENERRRLMKTKAYSLYITGKQENISLRDFYQFARINDYFKEKSRNRRFAIISNSVKNDKDLYALWQYLVKKFPEEF